MCSRALCNLSTDFAKEMLASSSTVKTAIFLISRTEDLQLQVGLLSVKGEGFRF